MKKLLWLAIFAILLAGSGAGAYYYFQQPAEASIDASDTNGAPGKRAKLQETAHYEYVMMDPLVLPVVDEYGVSQVISLVVVIEVEDSSTADKVQNMSPRLKDAYLQYLYGALSRRTVLEEGVLRVDIMKDLLNRVTTKVLGEGVAHDVLLQTVQQRSL